VTVTPTTPAAPVVKTPITSPVAPAPVSQPTPPAAVPSLPILPNTVGLAGAFLPPAGLVVISPGPVASFSPPAGPSGAFAITANLPALPPYLPFTPQIVGGNATPSFLSPWVPEQTGSLPVPSVVLDIPAAPFLAVEPGREPVTSPGMGPLAESEVVPLSQVTTTALRLGTSVSDADDSAELFYTLGRKGTDADVAMNSRTEASSEPESPDATSR
jgi:hypothetical protein